MQPEHSATQSEVDALYRKVFWRTIPNPDHQLYHRFRRPRQCRLRQAAIHERPRIYRGRIRSRRRPVLSRLQRLRDSEQPPSAKTGARLTLLRIMVLWGACSAALALMSTPAHFYVSAIVAGCGGSRLLPGRPLLSDNVDSGVPARPLHRHVHVARSAFPA